MAPSHTPTNMINTDPIEELKAKFLQTCHKAGESEHARY